MLKELNATFILKLNYLDDIIYTILNDKKYSDKNNKYTLGKINNI
jgi:hypothetical protein